MIRLKASARCEGWGSGGEVRGISRSQARAQENLNTHNFSLPNRLSLMQHSHAGSFLWRKKASNCACEMYSATVPLPPDGPGGGGGGGLLLARGLGLAAGGGGAVPVQAPKPN